MDATLPLRTERLTLREFVETDWEAVHAYASDYHVVRYMAWGPNTVGETKAFVAKAVARQAEKPRTHYDLAMILRVEGRLIGACSLVVGSAEHQEGWIGYCLSRQAWGQGYATEAAGALLALAFERLGLHRIFATCDAANAASARVMEKAGMLPEGCLREHRMIKGCWRDSLVYALLAREWDRLQTAGIPCPATTRRQAACAPA